MIYTVKRRMTVGAFALILAGCFGGTKPDTSFKGLIRAAINADNAMIVTGTALLDAGTITSAQAGKILRFTDQIKTVIDAARSAYDLGNTALATKQLSAATATLTTLQVCTGPPNSGLTLDSCLAPLVQP